MMRRIGMFAIPAVLLLAACVTNSNSPFPGDKVSLQRASQDNVALGMQYLQQGNRDAAMQMVQKAIQEDPDNAGAYAVEALVFNANEDTDKARDAYRTALRKAPDDPEIQNDYAVFLCQRGKAAESVEYFLKAANNPHYLTPEGAYANAGLCALLIPDDNAAEQYLRKALIINPNMPEPLFQLAQLSYNQKKYLSARAFIERFNALLPNSRPDALLLGVRNERALGNAQGAADYAKQLLHLYPTSQQAQQLDQTVPRG